MKPILAVLAVLALSLGALAQSQPLPDAPGVSQFSINASASSLSGNGESFPATEIGFDLQVTDNAFFRQTNLLIPGASLSAYFGGIKYQLPSSILAKTKLPSQNMTPYITAGLGVDRVNLAAGTKQSIAGYGGAGLSYAPAGNSKLSVQLIEVKWMDLPNFNKSAVEVSGGLVLHP